MLMDLKMNTSISKIQEIIKCAAFFTEIIVMFIVLYSQNLIKNWQSTHKELTSSLTLHFYFHVFVADIDVLYIRLV
jgi:hypothetical protein